MNEKKTCKVEISQSFISFTSKNNQDETMIFWVGTKYYGKVKEAIAISQELRKTNSDQVKELTFQ
ncbi:MAG: hypothetical protein IBV52_08405 [Candidatus Bathyarchaeota archaeon]